MTVEIIPFEQKYTTDFYNLNIEWLKSLFYVEPYDEMILKNCETHIIDQGGHIFFAKLNNDIVGTVALMKMEGTNNFELTKMAVSPTHRGFKIGQKLMHNVIHFAKTKQIPKLIIYSNRKLENAIYVYKKYGFVEIPLEENNHYERADIKMELAF
ncbi:GNAT family N-acetyltransferase [Algibacter lectus]|uniref:Ribosomal protein S18 acetylase RimI-like enzyme n=1 Tax=Algibacter lectus TaxID=221126 RepID=A0A4R8MJA1_9FLAO|nr:GNAT family N-acetyltransferase [Algibacter lectus]MWW25154.1 GNAT family N-acetyltransferase [Algibacter lectus]TDY64432.1 ribosomal protein S18 acetylase RimI-like enzyme [Algibacter lectus]